ncbi:methylated-DNA--[protein]-cysteine S-methyltransferase [Nesterenkonia sp. F]|uniref:methylated-DNA--[protein]-cysteine S-methyltransferase n=1 Tax=Nesterenkonia sp. F TaxID=795955 RepID=UPI000255D103|nr:methylated-DNA--[protein]-cysteine S-methyltransferase [Nesterenkonia sp. F]
MIDATRITDTTHTLIDSPLGPLTLVTDGTALTGLHLAEHRHTSPELWGPAVSREQAPAIITEAAGQLDAYFAGERRSFDLPLAPSGTAFQQAVWSRLREIPHGETVSYGAIAAALDRPGASRAVGLAVGRNPLSIIVPCHRVVGADGSLTGYGGGVERKQRLLALERGEPLLPLDA